MLKERIFKLAGDDFGIIQRCNSSTQARFLKIGLFVPLVQVLCFISSYFTFRQLFNNFLLSIVLSLFFSWMITNMYRLLLYTLTKSALPDVREKPRDDLSLFVRIVFVCFISLIVSIPAESMLYAKVLDRDMKVYKEFTKKNNLEKISFYYRKQVDEIKRLSKSPIYQRQFIKDKERERLRTIANMSWLVDSSNYYLLRIQILCTKHPSSWFFTFLAMLLFNIPVYLKYKMSCSDYYAIKGAIEQRVVELNYYAFKKKYATVFSKKYGQLAAYSEPYKDAPYNTVRKNDNRKFLTEQDLLSELYNV